MIDDEPGIVNGSSSERQFKLAALLHSQGNSQVSLVLTSGKGYRAEMGGARMPHSWSIVDEADLARWIAGRLD